MLNTTTPKISNLSNFPPIGGPRVSGKKMTLAIAAAFKGGNFHLTPDFGLRACAILVVSF